MITARNGEALRTYALHRLLCLLCLRATELPPDATGSAGAQWRVA